MRAVDTNIVVRVIVADDAVQLARAAAIIAAGVVVPLTVLLETEWVLRSNYRFARTRIADALTGIFDIETIVIADEPLVRWAIERYRAGADFADMLHLIAARGAEAFVTFDRDLAKDAGAAAPVAVETIE